MNTKLKEYPFGEKPVIPLKGKEKRLVNKALKPFKTPRKKQIDCKKKT